MWKMCSMFERRSYRTICSIYTRKDVMNRNIVFSCVLVVGAGLISGCGHLCKQNAKFPGIMPFGCSADSYNAKPHGTPVAGTSTTPTAPDAVVAAK